jgi:hypothetical protein
MASGYTYKIIDGEITTLKQFAFQCVRAFGATIHMRDDSNDAEYRPREVSTYYNDAYDRTQQEFNRINKMTDKEFEKILIDEWNDSIKYNKEQIEKTKKNAKVLYRLLAEAKAYEPPSDNHIEFKNFMISQLEKTIEHDCSIDFYLNELKKLSETLKSYNVEELKEKKLELLRSKLSNYKEDINKEIKRCNESNEWVAKVFKSFE